MRPNGAFYQMVPLAPGVDSRLAALDLVDHGVATAPGTAFGDIAGDHLRVSLAASQESLRTGFDRIVAWAAATGAPACAWGVEGDRSGGGDPDHRRCTRASATMRC